MLSLLRHFTARKQEYLLAYQNICNPQWTSCKYESIADEGFQKNVFVYRAINLIARGIASIPFIVRNRDSQEENQNITKILHKPNKNQSKNAFFESVVNYLLIAGNTFIYCDNKNQLRCLRPDRVQVVPNQDKTEVEYYIYSVDSKKYQIAKTNMLHLKLFNPLNDWYGLSPLQVASRAIDQHNEMSKHNVSILQNGGRPSGCLIVKNSENLTPEQREQLRIDVREAYAGTANSGKIMLLEGGLEWKEMGLSLKDLDFNEGKNLTSREIAQAFGVPPVLIGIKGDTAFTSYKEARLHFWEDTVLPLAELIRLELNTWLSEKFRQNVEIILNLDAVHALSSKRESLWHSISSADFLTIDEKRKIFGYPPLKEQDKI